MLGKIKDAVDNLIQDFTDKLPNSLKTSETHIKAVVESYEEKMSKVKNNCTSRVDKVNEEIRRIKADINRPEEEKNNLINQRNEEVKQINEDYLADLEKLRKQRDDELTKIAQADLDEIRRIQKEKDEQISRLEKENEEYIQRLQRELDEDIKRSREESNQAIDKLRKDKDNQIAKFTAEYEKLREKYKAPVQPVQDVQGQKYGESIRTDQGVQQGQESYKQEKQYSTPTAEFTLKDQPTSGFSSDQQKFRTEQEFPTVQ